MGQQPCSSESKSSTAALWCNNEVVHQNGHVETLDQEEVVHQNGHAQEVPPLHNGGAWTPQEIQWFFIGLTLEEVGEWEAIATVWIRTHNAAEVEDFANMNDIRL
ncbi:hypothetical protein P8452_44682 [Trifolium repens]|nr:hypothetical protein P8452_44682 [Trifolium repens]